MSETRRKYFVGGNWKLNGTKESIKSLVGELNTISPRADHIELLIAPPTLYLPYVQSLVTNDLLQIGAQNCWKDNFGAFTGETSPQQLKDCGIPWVILGHSERRNIFGETSELVTQKTQAALNAGLKVVFCCGERLQEREAGKTIEVVQEQLAALKGITHWESIVIAYEPVWAIGTGKVATPEQAQEVHAVIRDWLSKNLSPTVAQQTRIIYGGSVTSASSTVLGLQPDVDGFLVGGASLKGPEFIQIVTSFENAKNK
eukprot:TRINITY_DN3630_c0_g1_i1.p1 TRINITY_DN3630_c0_g1~~TRINITY_DN3630_c0_g1_i1.p1  ORF type:complete len:280 (+),score=54.46 TRINITY_DN3630_c0_g1_i1:67-840(+)